MAAYLIAGINSVSDQDTFADYQRHAIPSVMSHGGKILAGAASECAEGDWRPAMSMLIEFPDMAALRAWCDSEEYRAVRPLRQRSADVDIVFVAGT